MVEGKDGMKIFYKVNYYVDSFRFPETLQIVESHKDHPQFPLLLILDMSVLCCLQLMNQG